MEFLILLQLVLVYQWLNKIQEGDARAEANQDITNAFGQVQLIQ